MLLSAAFFFNLYAAGFFCDVWVIKYGEGFDMPKAAKRLSGKAFEKARATRVLNEKRGMFHLKAGSKKKKRKVTGHMGSGGY